jgi:hypothetical protein
MASSGAVVYRGHDTIVRYGKWEPAEGPKGGRRNRMADTLKDRILSRFLAKKGLH